MIRRKAQLYTPRDFRALWPEFLADSWSTWNSIEDSTFGMTPDDPALVLKITGRTTLPTSPVSELWVIGGRSGGKSRWESRTLVFFATGRVYRRAPGELIYCAIFAPDRRQAKVTFRYTRALFRAVPALERMIVRETHDSIELDNGCVVEVLTASTASPRGRSYAIACIEEACFLQSDDSANPDTELLRSLRPALSRVPGSLLAIVSSPYARRGEVWKTYQQHYGKDSDSILVVQADTLTLNPTFSKREIERAYQDDPQSAAAEYGAEFRSDVAALLDESALAAVVAVGVHELPPNPDRAAFAHFDAATGSGADSAALAIAFAPIAPGAAADLALVRRWKPPFSPSKVIAECAGVLTSYGIQKISIDRYAPNLIHEFFREHRIECTISERDTSASFVGLLALINSERARLLDDPTLLAELRRLERRATSGGRDVVSHPPGGHDDMSAAAAQSLGAAVATPKIVCTSATWGRRRGYAAMMRGAGSQKARPTTPEPERTSHAILKRRIEFQRALDRISQNIS